MIELSRIAFVWFIRHLHLNRSKLVTAIYTSSPLAEKFMILFSRWWCALEWHLKEFCTLISPRCELRREKMLPFPQSNRKFMWESEELRKSCKYSKNSIEETHMFPIFYVYIKFIFLRVTQKKTSYTVKTIFCQ